uniref:Uncharacterized protein n=1 Tax=Octactis speculum TaxID=3111310 RepID=A0A7S2CCF6_9STRA|mmetsp:Transcript_345/g.445  ORF Transcript_345/g.445 Transcript_345/m.445 type:complete len:309 (+) Transcript_345:22-948(+)
MFDPSAVARKSAIQTEKRKAQTNIKQWVVDFLPDETAKDVETVTVQEVQCGDPNCAPIDTAITVYLKEGTQLASGIPKESHMVTKNDIEEAVQRMQQDDVDEPMQMSPKAMEAFQIITQNMLRILQPLPFSDKLAVCENVFRAVENAEGNFVQAERSRRGGAGTNRSNRLLSAAQQNNAEEVKKLIDEGMDPSEGNSMGQTALHVATLWGNVESARILIVARADLNRKNDLSGGTPLHIAASSPKPIKGRLLCAQALIEAGADVNVIDGRGMTPLATAERAAQEDASNEPMVELLRVVQRSRMDASET